MCLARQARQAALLFFFHVGPCRACMQKLQALPGGPFAGGAVPSLAENKALDCASTERQRGRGGGGGGGGVSGLPHGGNALHHRMRVVQGVLGVWCSACTLAVRYACSPPAHC